MTVLALIVPIGAQKRTAPVRLFITSVGAVNGFTDPNKDNQDTMKDLRDEVKGRKSLALAESRDDAAIVLVVMKRPRRRPGSSVVRRAIAWCA
jgi:hypothetical protein